MSDLILKELYGIYETKNLTNEEIKNYKMTEREIFEKYDDLSGDELNTKSNKNVYVENDVMTVGIKRCRDEKKKRGERKIDGSIKKLMIPEPEIPECPEHEVKSKKGNIFVNEKILEECSVAIYKIGPYFCEHYKEKIQVDKNGCEYILFRIDVYFTEYLLAVEIDEKRTVAETLFLRRNYKKHWRKDLVVNLFELIRVSVMMKIMKLVE